jgi:hypothetical protein
MNVCTFNFPKHFEKLFFKILVAALFVKRMKSPPTLLLARMNALDKVRLRYIVTRIVLNVTEIYELRWRLRYS